MKTPPEDILKQFVIPHIGLTTFKYRATAAYLIKQLNYKISIDQFVTLNILKRCSGISQQDLAQMIYKDKSNFSRISDDLEKKGYITRKLDTKGKRVIKKLFITQKGEQAVENVLPFAKSLHETAFKGIPQNDLEKMKDILQKIRNNLDEFNIEELG